MGKLVVTEFISLDGVIEAPGWGEDYRHAGWTFSFDRGADGERFKLAETHASDALLFGRTTYEGMAAAWPDRRGEFADRWNALPKFVVSSTLSDPTWANTTVLRGHPAATVPKLKDRFAGDIVLHGSARLAQALIDADLVDELRLMLFPVVLGAGTRLFGDVSGAKRFSLTGTEHLGDGIVILIYRPRYDYVVSRDVGADPATVWSAWTRPEEYGKWFGARPGSVRLDVRPGGKWQLELPGHEDNHTEMLAGSYLEVVTHEKLVMLTEFSGGDTVMEMVFVPISGGTRIAIQQTCGSITEQNGARAGSEYLLDSCAAYLDKPA